MLPSDLIWADLEDRFAARMFIETPARVYIMLYEDQQEPLGGIFSYIHSRLNWLLEFLNNKARGNHHFNADESRDLINLIEEIYEIKSLLRKIGVDMEIETSYAELFERCLTFLKTTSGSEIPEDFKPIQIIKYQPVFWTLSHAIAVPASPIPQKLKLVGAGSYANVHVFEEPTYGFRVAVKTARKSLSERELLRFRKEFDLLKKLNNPYILRAYWFDSQRNRYTMEYCDSTLKDFIDRHNQHITFGIRKRVALQLLYGLNYLHSKAVLHRDLSYNNIMVQKFDFPAVVIKLSDFGLHKDASMEMTMTDSSMKGTIIDPMLGSFKEYSTVNEIYSVGAILSFIFSGRKALNSCKGPEKAIIDKCIHSDPGRRYQSIRAIIGELESISKPISGPL